MNQVQKHRRRKVITAHNKQRADVTGQAYSAGYEAIPHIWFNRPMDLPPFSFATIRGMLIDPEIRLNFATRAAPLCAAEFGWKEGEQWVEGVKCKQPEIAQYIYRQLQHIWRNFLPAILRAQVWGWSAGEVVMKLGENGLIEIDKLEPRHASDVRLLKQGFDRWGVAIDRVEDRGSVQLPFPYAWFHAYNAEDGDDYGVSAAHGAYSPWADKWFNGGAKDVRRLFMHKDAYGGIDLGYPEGETWVEGVENPIPNRDIARSIVEQLKAGGVTTRPSTRDENGNEKWPLTRATVASNPQHILEYPKDLDNEIRHGMEIPDGVSDSAGSGEWAGKRVTVAAFYASLDQWAVQILRDIKEQILDHLCRLNFGSVPNYEICHKPLAEQAMEQQSNAGPGQEGPPGQPGMPGQQGMPPDMQGQPGQMPSPMAQPAQPQQQQPQPIGMGLIKSLGSNETTLAQALEEVKRVARLSLAQVDDDNAGGDEFEMTEERIDALAELLAAIYGDDAESKLDDILPDDLPVKLALWNPSDHPRGPNGRFIQKGSDEAYATAKEKVDEAHRSRSSDSMSDLMSHLNTLTIKQLHSLKKDYGTKGSAKTKSALVAKLSERLTSGRHRLARRDDDTPVAPVNEEVYSVPTGSLKVDPKRFQYKVKGISGDKGVGEELKGTSKWNPELGGVLLVWRDPETGNDFVVNGHHRHELASRTGNAEINVRYIEAANSKLARAKGALANIAEGRGTALDAAKYLRDSDRGIDHLQDAGISMSGKIASDAEQLTKLGSKSFQAVANGMLDEDKAIAVAKWLPDTNLQDKLFKKLAMREDDGKDWTLREIEQAAKKMDRAGKITTSGTDLFGDFESEESTFDQEVEIESYISRQLTQEANDFGAVANTRRAERVSEAGNTLATDENQRRRDSAREQASAFDRESGLRGEVADTIKTHAAELAKAKNRKERDEIKRKAFDDIRDLLAAPKPGIEMPERDNEEATDGDQLGLFGDVTNVPSEKPRLSEIGESRGRSQALFDTGGDRDQILLFDDGVTPDDRVWRKAMSLMKQYDEHPGEFSLSDEEAQEIERDMQKLLKLINSPQRMSAVHAPKGGATVAGKQFRGGEFIPKEVMAQATPQEKAKLTGGQAGGASKSAEVSGSQQTPQQPSAAQPQGQAAQPKPLPVSPGAVNKAGRDTFEQHQSNGQWSPARQKLHQQIIDKHFAGKKPAPQGAAIAYVLGGGPASGKSSIVNAGHLKVDPDTIHIDSDAIKAEIPEYNEMLASKDHRAASHVHEESSYIAKLIQDKASRGGYHTLLDGTGDSSLESLKGKVDKMRASGQKVVGSYVTVPTEMAIQRNIERAKKTGRLPPESMLRLCHKSVSNIVPQAIQAGLFDQFDLWDTENGVQRVASVQDGKLQVHNPELWKKFVAKGTEGDNSNGSS